MIVDSAHRAVLVLVCFVFGVLPVHASECKPELTPLGPGMDNGFIYDLCVFDDGSGPALFAGGSFEQSGVVQTHCLAKWDGSSWSSLGLSSNAVTVTALTVFDDGSGPALYAGGRFTGVPGSLALRIARWDGSSWSPLGSGMSGDSFTQVHALAVFDDGTGPALYAAGLFTHAGGSPASNIAKWDGSSWSPLGSGTNSRIDSLTVFDDGSGPALYAAGTFTQAGGDPASRIARWDGASWSTLGSGTNEWIFDLTVFDDGSGPALYAGGNFWLAGGNPASRIAKWDGASWSALGSGIPGTVRVLQAFDDGSGPALYVGGQFEQAGGISTSRLAKWDGSSWSSLGLEVNGGVLALTDFDDGSGPVLYLGGGFTESCGRQVNKVARWGCVPPRACAGDINLDGIIDLADLSLLLTNYGSQTFCGDTNGDGLVDLEDLSAVLNAFGTACP